MIQRHPDNPILTADDVPYPATLIFNAGVCRFGDQFYMVFRNDHGRWGDPVFDGTNLGLATSSDGFHWEVAPEPCIDHHKACELIAPFYRGRDVSHELKRFYDPRLTVIDDRVVMCFAVDTAHGLRGGLATTTDFREWEVLHLTAPDNRNLVLFLEKINGEYLRLERPFNQYGGEPMGEGRFAMWLSRSPDLRAWSTPELVIAPEDVPFCNNKMGPGAPPIRTDDGWLCSFHAVQIDKRGQKNGWEDSWEKIYYAGAALLDLDDPSRVLAMLPEPLLSPLADYETGEGATPETNGFRNDVIFPGGLVESDDGVFLYYGAADTTECVAKLDIKQTISAMQPQISINHDLRSTAGSPL